MIMYTMSPILYQKSRNPCKNRAAAVYLRCNYIDRAVKPVFCGTVSFEHCKGA